MTKAAIIGYASIDYPAVLDGFFRGNETVLIKERPADAFPRPGGCPLYVAVPIAEAGLPVSIITWVGDDSLGDLFTDHVKERNIDTESIATVDKGATPICFLLYQEDGSCGCCFDPGFLGSEELTHNQLKLIQDTELLCFTVGPPDVALAALDHCSEDKKIAWVAKNDPKSYPEKIRGAIGRRADYIFCNASERPWVDAALKGRAKKPPLIVETNGAEQVSVCVGDDPVQKLNVQRLSFNDASGAGDTLAGGCLAAILDGVSEPIEIGKAGVEASRRLLSSRKK